MLPISWPEVRRGIISFNCLQRQILSTTVFKGQILYIERRVKWEVAGSVIVCVFAQSVVFAAYDPT